MPPYPPLSPGSLQMQSFGFEGMVECLPVKTGVSAKLHASTCFTQGP